MVVVLKLSGTMLRLKGKLKIEVTTSASWLEHGLRARSGMLSRPAALRGLVFLRALCTWSDDMVGGGGGSIPVCVCHLSVCLRSRSGCKRY